jgi:hypothetical protein
MHWPIHSISKHKTQPSKNSKSPNPGLFEFLGEKYCGYTKKLMPKDKQFAVASARILEKHGA